MHEIKSSNLHSVSVKMETNKLTEAVFCVIIYAKIPNLKLVILNRRNFPVIKVWKFFP